MKDNNEHDALGELFRRRLENHRIMVDGSGWNVMERRLGKRKKKVATWLWSVSAAAAAASFALTFTILKSSNDDTSVMTISQQAYLKESETTHHELTPNPADDKMMTETISKNLVLDLGSIEKSITVKQSITLSMQSVLFGEIEEIEEIEEVGKTEETGKNDQNEEGYPVLTKVEKVVPKLDISHVADLPDEEEESGEMGKKWLFAATFGTGNSTSGFRDTYEDLSSSSLAVKDYCFYGNNNYAANLSSSISSFNKMSKEEFTNIQYSMPFSFGLTARKTLGKVSGVESGLVYTYLSSNFKWGSHDAQQSLHYLGIPVNMVVSFGNTNSNWRFYLSGGFMVEKCVRAVYRQERRQSSEIRNTDVKSSSIGGLQWSLNGALGVNYRLEKGWGIYFEPRVGYSFDCNQPISVRTEMPVFFGINIGLNYEL